MTIAKRSVVTLTGMALVIAAGTLPLFAQEPATKPPAGPQEKSAPAPAPKKKYDPSRRVPDYFGQIGLTTEQRESIYKARRSHQEKIDALRKQIVEAEAKSMGECEAVLNETQKKLLENLRSAGSRGTASAKPVDAGKTSK